VRRLLQFATITFLLVTLLTPVIECFDRWDAPGLRNDTEFAVFAVVLLVCLVLLVASLVSAAAQRTELTVVRVLERVCDAIAPRQVWFVPAVAPTGTPPPLPLRI
jgi:hypothetical protein